jgi:hypothetical protein
VEYGEGVRLCHDDDRKEALLSVTGAGFHRLSLEAECRFVKAVMVDITMEVDRWPRFTATRVDVRFDDFARSVSYEEMWRIASEKRFGPFRSCVPHGMPESGWTFSFGLRGKKGCGHSFNVYDKNAESQGACNCIRFESSWYKERADSVLIMLGNAIDRGGTDEYLKRCGSLVFGAMDFWEDGEHTQHTAFWRELAAGYGTRRPMGPRKEIAGRTRLKGYIRHSVAPVLAALCDAEDAEFGPGAGERWLQEVLAEGRRKIADKPRYRKLIEASKPPEPETKFEEIQAEIPF